MLVLSYLNKEVNYDWKSTTATTAATANQGQLE